MRTRSRSGAMLFSAPLEVARTKATTLAPNSTSASVRCEPMNPSAPVTRTVRPVKASPSSCFRPAIASFVQTESLARPPIAAKTSPCSRRHSPPSQTSNRHRRRRVGAVRGWGRLYATSVGLGLRCLLRHGYEKEALVRILVPMDPSRYLELPWALRELRARPGRRVLDLASPKLLAVTLARGGLDVTSVDE